MKAGLAEHALVGIDRAAFSIVANRDSANEVGGRGLVDDLKEDRSLTTVHFLRDAIDEVLDHWDVNRGRCAGALPAP